MYPRDTNPAEIPFGTLSRAVAPTIDPVTLAEAKKHLNLDHTDDDAFVADLISVATAHAESYTNRQLITATYQLVFNGFPGIIFLPKPPALSITSLVYVDGAGTTQTLTQGTDFNWQAPSGPFAGRARVFPAYGLDWPSARNYIPSVSITYTAGYGATAATVPIAIRQAIKAVVATLYEYREEVVTGTIKTEIPEVARRLLYPYRVLAV